MFCSAMVLGVALGGCHAMGHRDAAGPCRANQLTVRPVRVSAMTGEEAIQVRVRDTGAACTLIGSPAVTLRTAAGRLLHLSVVSHSQYVPAVTPRRVRLGRGSAAYLLVAKYRCDVGQAARATWLMAALAHHGGGLSVPVGSVDLARCRGGAGDPGNTIAVSAFSAHPIG